MNVQRKARFIKTSRNIDLTIYMTKNATHINEEERLKIQDIGVTVS